MSLEIVSDMLDADGCFTPSASSSIDDWYDALRRTFEGIRRGKTTFAKIVAYGALKFGFENTRLYLEQIAPEGYIDGTIANANRALNHLERLPQKYLERCADSECKLTIWDVAIVMQSIRGKNVPAFSPQRQLELLDAITEGVYTVREIMELRREAVEMLNSPTEPTSESAQQLETVLLWVESWTPAQRSTLRAKLDALRM